MKFKSILLPLLLAIGLIGPTFAGFLDDWPDDALCGWMENPSPPAHIVEEVKKRGISCEGGKAVAVAGAVQTKKTTTSQRASSSVDKEIKIYDVAFSPEVLDELLNLVISKTDYDFSNHKLSKNDKDITCIFRIARIIYDVIEEGSIEGWNLAEGNINIMGSDVEFSKRARWNMGGLSSDPSYFRDEVNIKLTDSGHLVGKIAYFTHTVKQGETPRNPIYPTLTEHKRSTPINLSNIKNINAKLFIDVEDWAGGVMYINYCKDL
jgi:hypothetical protein